MPVQRNAADWTSDEGKRKHADTTENCPVNDPDVSLWIDKRANKSQCNHDVRKRKPVVAIHEERIFAVGIMQSIIYFLKPERSARWKRFFVLQEPAKLGFNRKGSDAADGGGNHKEYNQCADFCELFSAGVHGVKIMGIWINFEDVEFETLGFCSEGYWYYSLYLKITSQLFLAIYE